jgi:hypothetical protein
MCKYAHMSQFLTRESMRHCPAVCLRHGFCSVFYLRRFATKSLNKPLIRRPVPAHLHVVITDNRTQNIWTELCTKYYTSITTGLHGSYTDCVIFFLKTVKITKKREVIRNTDFPVDK